MTTGVPMLGSFFEWLSLSSESLQGKGTLRTLRWLSATPEGGTMPEECREQQAVGVEIEVTPQIADAVRQAVVSVLASERVEGPLELWADLIVMEVYERARVIQGK